MIAPHPARVVIIGAGHAGAHAVQALRRFGFEGDIVLVGDEGAAPYQRPPLSKGFLKGELDADRLSLRPRSFYDEQRVRLCLDDPVMQIDRQAQRVVQASGETIAYDRLIIATGARPRRAPFAGADRPGVMELRTLADARTLRSRLARATSLTVIGGGYIGLETAASARALGKSVTVLERAPRLLSRVAGSPVSAFYQTLHESRGSVVRCGVDVQEIDVDPRGGLAVELGGGERVTSDCVVIGVGVAPDAALAQNAGLACEDGVVVDLDARTSDPAIYAAGDCTRRPVVGREGLYRLESVHNAQEQASRAAAHIMGASGPLDAPWFWSDQFDVKLQTAGLSQGHDDIVIRGDADRGRFSAFYYRADTLLAVDAVNDPAAFLFAKKALQHGVQLDKSDAVDTAKDLRSLLRATVIEQRTW